MSLVPFCLSPEDEQHFLAVVIKQKQPGALCVALYRCTVAPTAGHLVGQRSSGDHIKNRPAAEGVHETLPKDVFPLQHRKVIFQAYQGSRAQRNLAYKFKHRRITSVV